MEQIIGRTTKFIIYGAGEIGQRIAIGLKRQGFSVIGVLDQHKEGELRPDVRVYRLGVEPVWKEEREEAIVIVALADGMQHKKVADTLFSRGYDYIVFLPMEYCIPDKQKRNMTKLYNKILSYPDEIIEEKVLHYKSYIENDLSTWNTVIREQNENMLVWMGMEILFSETVEMWRGDKTKITSKDEIKDKPIIFDDVHENIFSFFDLKAKTPMRYFEGNKKKYTAEERQQIINKREKLYHLYQREYNKGMDFFLEAAPQAMWNEKNYFNLDGGHHRTTFLLNKGHTLLPIIISKRDFEKWCNYEVYNKFVTYLREHHIECLYAPVPHPGMLNFPVECESFGETKLKCIMKFLAHQDILSMDILDCSRGQGYYARNLERIGVKKAVYIDNNPINVNLADLMNKLLYRNNVIVEYMEIENQQFIDKYDAIFVLDKFEGKLLNCNNRVMENLDRMTKKYMFLEFRADVEKDYILRNSNFFHFVLLHKEYRAGSLWNMGVFIKE